MDGLEFVAQIVATGRVYGVGIGVDLDEVDRAIGDVKYVDNTPGRRKSVLLRDYGLIEFTFNRTSESSDVGADGGAGAGAGAHPDAPVWTCCNFSLQLHRLESGSELRAEWHNVHNIELPARVTWGELRASVAREYQLPDPVERAEAGARYFRYPASRATVIVVDDSPQLAIADLENRSVHAVSVHSE